MGARACLPLILVVAIASYASAADDKKSGSREVDYAAIGALTNKANNLPPELMDDPRKLVQWLTANVQEHIAIEKFNAGIDALLLLAEQNDRAKTSDEMSRRERYRRELVKIVRDRPWLRVQLGNDAADRKDYQTALRDYEQAVKLDPGNREALLGYGHSARELGDYKLALAAARQLLRRRPGDKDALGLYHFANGRTSTVGLPSAIFQMGAIFSAGISDRAIGEEMPLPKSVGKAASPYGSVTASVKAVERSARITREAGAALRVKDYPAARELAGKAIELNARNAQALNFRAIASNRMLRFADAIADAGAVLALAPGNAPALQTRSWAFAKLGRYEEALRDAVDTLARDPANPYAYQSKALALAGLHDRAGALDALRRSAALDSSFLNRYERALQLPREADLTLLFDDGAAATAAASAAPPAPLGKRFARLAALSAVGGALIALGILHVVSAGWREKVRATFRRLRAPGGAADSTFWTRYELIREIGLGGMGVVYEAKDRSLDRRVAVKKMRDEIRNDSHERRRFVNEAKLVASLRHPNIVDIYAISEDGDDVYLVFEFVEGRTLHDRIKSEAPMTLEAARGVLGAAASAVEYAHARRIVHRDLKPSNIMIAGDGRVKVMDFGVARQAKDAITKMSAANTVAGTPLYMAPEQEQGVASRESDVYALGVCLYEMLTGRLPFDGGGAAMLINKLNGKHIPPTQRDPSLPAALDEVIAKALTPDPQKRYHTPTELVAALGAVVAVKGR